jgi:hypothetical protein
MWVFEQTQALEIFNVYTPVRMTVIKLKSRGLWVHAPVAPTEECIRLLKVRVHCQTRVSQQVPHCI